MRHWFLLLIAGFGLIFTSCKKQAQVKTTLVDTPQFNNVLILGNSITYSPANPSIGWLGNWGMAATVADSDYVHLLTAKFKKLNPKCIVTATSIAAWEFGYDTPGAYDIPTNLTAYKALKPDLVIFRIGENVNQAPLDTTDFGIHYRALLSYFNQGEVILAVGSVWPRPVTDTVMKHNSPNFKSLGILGADGSIYSFGAWADYGVELHPRDLGHRLIADTIWNAVLPLRMKIKR